MPNPNTLQNPSCFVDLGLRMLTARATNAHPSEKHGFIYIIGRDKMSQHKNSQEGKGRSIHLGWEADLFFKKAKVVKAFTVNSGS